MGGSLNNSKRNSREMALRPEIILDLGQKRTIVSKVDQSPEPKIKVEKDQLNEDS